MLQSALGVYGDLVYRGDELLIARSIANAVATTEWTADVTEHNYLMFINAIIHPDTGKLFVAGKANNSGITVIVSNEYKQSIPFGYGNYPNQLAIVNGQIVCYVVLNLTQYGMYDIAGNLLQTLDIPEQHHGTSQGIRFVGDDGKVFWGDQTIGGIFDGVIIREWMQRSGYTAGQGQSGGLPIVGNGINYTYNPGGNTSFPRIAVNGDYISLLYVDGVVTYWDTLLASNIGIIIPSPVEGDIMIPAFEKPMWQAPFFSHSSRYGDTPLDKHIGNAIWLPTSDKSHNPGVLPLITAVDTNISDADQNLTIAYWESAGDIGSLVNAVNVALSYPEKPIIAYLDGDNWPASNPFISKNIWPSIQAYRFPGESLSTFKSRVETVIQRVQSYGLPLVLTSRFDDFNGSQSIDNILECMPIYEEWIRNYNFVGHMPFSDRRGNAISSNDRLWTWARAFQYAIPAQRPNRFDYWRPAGLTEQQVLENKLGQTRTAIVLEKYLRDYILSFDDVPEPGPGPEPTEWPDLLHIVKEVRAKYPALVTVDQCVAIVNDVAKAAPPEYEFGLLKKSGGNHGTLPNGTPCSVDWCVSKVLKKGTDCLGDCPSSTDGPATGPANPNWGDGVEFNTENWVKPI